MSSPFPAQQANAFSRDETLTLVPLAAPIGLTGLTGGGALKLDGIDVANLPVGQRISTVISGVRYDYTLTTSASAESSPWIIAPDSGNTAVRWILDAQSLNNTTVAPELRLTGFNGDLTSGVLRLGSTANNYIYFDGSSLMIRVGGADQITISSTTATFAGNLTVNGTGTSSLNGLLRLKTGAGLSLDTSDDSGIYTAASSVFIYAPSGKNIRFNAGGVSDVAIMASTGVTIKGTTTNDNAASLYVGELLSTVVASGSAVSLTTATSTNLTSVSLTAGDWDVFMECIYIPGATTSITQLSQGISTTTGALPTATTGAGDYTVYSTPAIVPGANNISQTVGPFRVSLSATTTVYAVARPTFTVSTLTVYGVIRARRVR